MLKVIRVLDPLNIVKFQESFDYMGTTCLVFEMLDKSLLRRSDLSQNRYVFLIFLSKSSENNI